MNSLGFQVSRRVEASKGKYENSLLEKLYRAVSKIFMKNFPANRREKKNEWK